MNSVDSNRFLKKIQVLETSGITRNDEFWSPSTAGGAVHTKKKYTVSWVIERKVHKNNNTTTVTQLV